MSVWVLLFCLAVLFIVRNWPRFTRIVHAHEVKRSDAEEDLYECMFYWRGCKRYGYFYYLPGKEPPEDVMLKVVGIDCEAVLWHLEVYDNK